MALKDKIAFGTALPHRSPEPIDMPAVVRVAQRAEALGFRDLWVTENTLDHVFCFDPVVVLTYAASVTTTIRLGASVVVLPVHLTWYGLREFDVAAERPRLLLYSIVLSQGRRNDLARFINPRRLRDDWPQLRPLLSGPVRRACERKLGLRATDHRADHRDHHRPAHHRA